MINPINKSILTRTIRPLPRGLIYHHPANDVYNLIETKSGKLVGTLVAYTKKADLENFYKISEEDTVLHIDTLHIEPSDREKGWGKYLINFAKNESYKKKCHGRLSLVAYNYGVSPHAFYKKLGFVTLNKRDNELLDECNQEGVKPIGWRAMDMYLDLQPKIISPKEKPKNKHKTIKNFLKTLLGL